MHVAILLPGGMIIRLMARRGHCYSPNTRLVNAFMYHKRNEEGTASRIQDRNDEGLLHARIHHLFLPPKLLSITLFGGGGVAK
jgi:hypothetical protein